MNPQGEAQRWYVHRNGETSGPHDETTIIGWIRNGMRDAVIRTELAPTADPWLPLAAHAPFAAAFTTTSTAASSRQRKPGPGVRTVVLGLLLLPLTAGAILVWLRALMGERASNTALSTIVRSPIDLEDEIVSVPAMHARGIPIRLPYPGDVSLEVTVLKGEHVNVYVVDDSEWSAFAQSNEKLFGGRFRHYPAFESTKAAHSRASAPLAEGGYYIIVDNPTFGWLVAPSFDVKVRARLTP